MEPKFDIYFDGNSYRVEALGFNPKKRYKIQFINNFDIVYETIIGDNCWTTTGEPLTNIRIFEEEFNF